MAGFFVRTYVVEADEARMSTSKKFYVGEKSTGEVSFTVTPKDAQPGTKGEPVKPKFLGGDELQEPELPKDFKEPKVEPKEAPPKPLFSRREKVVEWITAKDNPYLARAAVNRIWAQFMGRGFVHPVDDFNSENDPSHPELLKAIESEFVAHQFDLKWLIREIVNSQAYQAADVGPVTDALPRYYERARIRPLSVEELTASLHIATGLGVESALKSEPVRGHGEVSRRAHRRPGQVSGKPDGAPVHSQRGRFPRTVLPAQRQPGREPAQERGGLERQGRADVFVGLEPDADHAKSESGLSIT